MNNITIDLFSDSMTKPTAEMRRFIYESEVGDEQKNEDPTVNILIDKCCDLFGKESALFMPTGTMCNLVAFLVHCEQGDEVILDATAHSMHYEVAGISSFAGAIPRVLNGENGIFTLDQFKSAIRPVNRHLPKSKMVHIEQTANLGGGAIWPLEEMNKICQEARANDIICHMDGARLLHAVVETNISAREYSENFDTVWLDFTKSLGAPFGAIMAGSREFIEKAWRRKQQLGGAMRQAGIMASAALYGLVHHTDKIKEDHKNAKRLAAGLSKIEFLEVDPVHTNLVFFRIKNHHLTARELADLCLEKGVRMLVHEFNTIRAVTHLDIDESAIDETLNIINEIFTRSTN